jgi:precorrin-2/cobalt-factor-2 C20-methyltransferase
MNTSGYGTLYGIGVGPGDPDLLPLKSVKIIQQVDVIFAASSTKNDHSQAVSIAAPHIPKNSDVRLLPFPMTKNREEKEACWQAHAHTIIAELEKGTNAAFLTLGDSLTYATYGYVLKYVLALAPDAPVVTIPGITAYQAAAARINRPLVEGEESLLVVSGVEGGHRLRQFSRQVENVVFMKAYRNAADITDALNENHMLENSVAVANCSLENEEVIDDVSSLKQRAPGYWTLILAKKNGHHGAP